MIRGIIMNRSNYWLRVVLLWIGVFMLGVFIGVVNNGEVPADMLTIIEVSAAIYMWVIGYDRCQDAGIHGGWAFFAPIVIGTIVLGCFRSSAKEHEQS